MLTAGKIAAMEAIDLKATNGGVELRVHVTPRARRPSIGGTRGGALKVAVSAPPVDGAANDAVIEALADALGIPKRRITLVRGASSREKTLRIEGVAVERVLALGRNG